MTSDSGRLTPPPTRLVPLTAAGRNTTALLPSSTHANSSRANVSASAFPRAYAASPGTSGGIVAPTTTNRVVPFIIAARPGTTFVSPFNRTISSLPIHGIGNAPIAVTTASASRVVVSHVSASSASHVTHSTRSTHRSRRAHVGGAPDRDAHATATLGADVDVDVDVDAVPVPFPVAVVIHCSDSTSARETAAPTYPFPPNTTTRRTAEDMVSAFDDTIRGRRGRTTTTNDDDARENENAWIEKDARA
jgi:hypothetical protein